MRQRVLVGWQVFDSQCRRASGGGQMCPERGPLHRHTAGVCSWSSRTSQGRRGERGGMERERASEPGRERESFFCTCSKCMMGSGAGRLQRVRVFVTCSGEVPLVFPGFLFFWTSPKRCRTVQRDTDCNRYSHFTGPAFGKRPRFVQ